MYFDIFQIQGSEKQSLRTAGVACTIYNFAVRTVCRTVYTTTDLLDTYFFFFFREKYLLKCIERNENHTEGSLLNFYIIRVRILRGILSWGTNWNMPTVMDYYNRSSTRSNHFRFREYARGELIKINIHSEFRGKANTTMAEDSNKFNNLSILSSFRHSFTLNSGPIIRLRHFKWFIRVYI